MQETDAVMNGWNPAPPRCHPNIEIMGVAGGSIKGATMQYMAGGAGFQPSTVWFRLQLFPWFNSFIFFPMCRIWYSTDWTGLLSPPFIWWSFVPWCWRRFVPCVPKIGIRTTRRTADGIGCRDRIPFGDVILRGQLDNFNKNEGEKGEILDQLSESYYIDSYWF